jgi:uncharacterized protein (UPF0332 family)
MSLDDEKRATIVQLEIEKAYSTFDDAQLLIDSKRWSSAANRLYYAVFHAVNALLIHDSHPVKSHKGSLSMFSKQYILTGILPSTYGELYSQLETIREESDYSCIYKVKPEILLLKREPARELIDTIAKMVSQQK